MKYYFISVVYDFLWGALPKRRYTGIGDDGYIYVL